MNVVEGIELKPCRSHGECLGFLCSIQRTFPFASLALQGFCPRHDFVKWRGFNEGETGRGDFVQLSRSPTVVLCEASFQTGSVSTTQAMKS